MLVGRHAGRSLVACRLCTRKADNSTNSAGWAPTRCPCLQNTRPSCATTKGCTNQCFGKFGFESPELEKKMDGWCNQWEHASVESAGFDDPVIGLGMVEVVNKGECWKACRDEPRCMQAVYEEGGSFGLQCWLGTSQMSMHPKPTRPNCTATPNCTNQCYGKFGFTGR